MKKEITLTEDGSHTLFVPELDEHYHSTHGAVQESLHVFIEAGLSQVEQKQISIFEVGFGTGLNCLLTYEYAESNQKTIRYHSIEKYPVEQELAKQLNHKSFIPDNLRGFYHEIHAQGWNLEVELRPNFRLKKIEGDLHTFETKGKFDLIYFDAFAPSKQADMWSQQIFEQMYAILHKGGMLVTYSSKGDVKRGLRAAGFEVKRLPGPPGKRDMVRAIKN